MSAEDFWEGDPRLARSYQGKARIQRDYQNQDAWLNGIYVLNAVNAALSEKAAYPEKPFVLNEDEVEKQEDACERGIAHMTAFAAAFNANRISE